LKSFWYEIPGCWYTHKPTEAMDLTIYSTARNYMFVWFQAFNTV